MGGGPAGCALAQKAEDAIVIEEHERIGEPVQCAGLVGGNVFGLGASKKSVINVIDGARICLGEDSFLLKKSSIAYVIDRGAFDRHLSEGIEIRTNTKYISHTIKKEKVIVSTNRGDIDCEYLIGADGPLSSVRKSFDFKLFLYPAMQYTIKGDFEKSFVHLYIEKPFFYYIVPEDERTARIGCILPNPKPRLDSFLEKKGFGRIISKTAGVISLGMGRTATERIAIVGDAACQTKPLTGGGLFFGLRAAGHLAEALGRDDLMLYERLWKRDFGWDIRSALFMRKLYESMNENEMEKAYLFLKENISLLERCDFDRHVTLFQELLKIRPLYSSLPFFLKLAFKQIFL